MTRPRLLLATHYWAPHVGGIERVAAAHATHLTAAGWQVDVHTSRVPSTAPVHEQVGTLTLHRHRAVDVLARHLQVPVPLPWPGLGRHLRAAARDADVVLAHGHTYPVSLLAARAARAARRPFVLVQHSPWVAYGPLLDAVERTADAVLGRHVIAVADRVVCVSDHTADYVRSLVPDARIVVLPNGVDTGRFRPAAGTSASRPVVLVVRRLVRRTGVDRLLTAWRLAGLDERAELHVVGDGPERAALEAAASDLTHVRFLGRVDDDALVAHYQRAHVSVVPTSSGEGFGLSAAESLACGTPVVAVDEGALREVVTDGVDGLLVAQADVAALGAALRRVVDDPALRARLAEGTGHRDWSGEQQAAALTGLLGELCGTGRTLHPGRTGARGAAAATGGAR